ncbi:transposase [Hymenobacter nivis]|uniref:transposase n=1 Tax=Hymenobacter nivis TaxID=1850093 RepID=UPI0013A583D6|nr:transposase [Hymenobacter nivis]
MQFCEVAQHLNDAVKPASNEPRVQGFFREVDLDYLVLARLLVRFLPVQSKLRLYLDRTEWAAGQCRVNILPVAVGQDAFQVPLYWELPDNRSGNSNAAQRSAVREVCRAVPGHERVGLVLGDRAFVGHAWFKWLQDSGLNFVMRLPRHHLLPDAHDQRQAIADLKLAIGQVRHFAQRQVDGIWGQVWVKALAGGDFLFLFGTAGLPDLGQLYARRWTIEQCIQNLKGRDFQLENSHLRCRHELRKLLALVTFTYAFCLSVGQAADQRTPIARKNHGYRATSLARNGLSILRQTTRPATGTRHKLVRLVEALLDWMVRQLTNFQTPVKIVG